MPGTCILTDSSVQFLNTDAQNCEHVIFIPHHLAAGENVRLEQTGTAAPATSTAGPALLQPPTVEEFHAILFQLSQKYQNIFVILLSSHLSTAYQNACEAVFQLRGTASFQVIDSQTIGAGLGMLVQMAVQAVQKGTAPVQINRLVRGMIPHVYTIFCLQSLHYLALSTHLDPAQASVADMLGIIPIYVLDGGKLVPVQKARNMRQSVDLMHEFVTEFERVDHIALLHGLSFHEQEIRSLQDRLTQDFPEAPISVNNFSPAMTALFGPRSYGIAVLEHSNEI
jgi:DegV family protein with EDD domain